MADGTLYDTDFVGWTEQQAGLLRDAGERRLNEPLDWDRLAEEIEDLGNSELTALSSQVRRVILHLLKLQFSPSQEPRRGWIDSIVDARGVIADKLGRTRSLRPHLASIIESQRPRAVQQAILALTEYDEATAADLVRAHAGAYTDVEILGDWFPKRPTC